MAGRLPIGVCLPTIGADAGWFLDAAVRLEAAGYDGIWCWDHLMPRGDGTLPVLEAWTMLAAVAARTSRVRVGSLVLDVTKRHPALVAKAAATVQGIAGGRLVLGMGIGGFPGEHAALGIPFPPAGERAVLLEESIAAIRALWSGEVVTGEAGAVASLRDARQLPAPRPVPPILVGAQSPAGVRLAARAADGWAAASTSFERLLPAYLDALAAAGRDRATQEVLVGMPEGRAGRDNVVGTPWAANPTQELARWLVAGADGVILMPRTAADVDALVDLRRGVALGDPRPVPAPVLDVIRSRSGTALVESIARALAEQATRLPVELVPHAGATPTYFRITLGGQTLAYVRPRPGEVRVEYRLPHDHWAYGSGFGRDSIYGIGLRIDGQTSFEVGLRLLADAFETAKAGTYGPS